MAALLFCLTSTVAQKLEVDNHQLLNWLVTQLKTMSKVICLYLTLDRGAIRQVAANTFQLTIENR